MAEAGNSPADLNWLSRLSYRARAVNEHEFKSVLGAIVNDQSTVYERGLAAAALGSLLQAQVKLRNKVGDLGVMDALIDLIGQTRGATRTGASLGCR